MGDVKSKLAGVVLHFTNEVLDSVSGSVVQGDDRPGGEESCLLELVVASGNVPGTLLRSDVHLKLF